MIFEFGKNVFRKKSENIGVPGLLFYFRAGSDMYQVVAQSFNNKSK